MNYILAERDFFWYYNLYIFFLFLFFFVCSSNVDEKFTLNDIKEINGLGMGLLSWLKDGLTEVLLLCLVVMWESVMKTRLFASAFLRLVKNKIFWLLSILISIFLLSDWISCSFQFRLFGYRTIFCRAMIVKWFCLLAIITEQLIKFLFYLLEQVHTVKTTYYRPFLGVLMIGKWW